MHSTPPPTVQGLLAQQSLRLSPRLTGATAEMPIEWVHSPDLPDPSPFLSGHTMLLTTGTQFPDDTVGDQTPGEAAPASGTAADAWYDAYVDRLVAAGTVGIGFGLEVIREGTPPSLVRACAERGVALVEVPYEIPFIALIRWVADRISLRERERDAWTLRAQRAVSVAALTTGTLDAVARVLAEQVAGTVVVLSSAGDVVQSASATAVSVALDDLTTEARRMLGRGTRASVDLEMAGRPGFATIQTLGPRGALRGAIAVTGEGRNDVGTQAVVTSAVAIAEVLLAKSDERRRLDTDLGGMLVRLLLDGHVDAAEAVAGEIGRDVPELLRVGVVQFDRAAESTRQHCVDVLAREVGSATEVRGDGLVFVIDASSFERLREVVQGDGVFEALRVGVSSELLPREVAAGLTQATRILTRSSGPGLAVYGVTAAGLLDDLWSPEAADVARRRLGALRGETGDLVQCARLWLTHNGHWESAAREAGLHRHTLKARVARVGTLLSLDLDTFAGRAELWALLEASHASR